LVTASALIQVSATQAFQSPTRGYERRAANERLIVGLELEVEANDARCEAYEQTVRELRTKLSKLTVKATTKSDLRKTYAWDGVDSTYADAIIKFSKEWLFPWFKFLHEGWMDYLESRKSLTMTIFRHCPVPGGQGKKDTWDQVIAPTVAKKYADMRCNINNEVRKAFYGKLLCCLILLWYHYPSSNTLDLASGDSNKSTIDPDKLSIGIIPYIKNNNSAQAAYPIYDFFASYVWKLHSDRYTKTTLNANHGQSFLDLIGPSDVAYVICLIKNSTGVWSHDPSAVAEDDGAEVTVPKPLYTRGETRSIGLLVNPGPLNSKVPGSIPGLRFQV
jgi:hypothetical protein